LQEYERDQDSRTAGGNPSATAAETAPEPAKTPAPAKQEEEAMGSLFAQSLSQELLSLDVMSMTPIEAMNALFRLQQEARKEQGL
jgi:DNA mismatch repair protein MutS